PAANRRKRSPRRARAPGRTPARSSRTRSVRRPPRGACSPGLQRRRRRLRALSAFEEADFALPPDPQAVALARDAPEQNEVSALEAIEIRVRGHGVAVEAPHRHPSLVAADEQPLLAFLGSRNADHAPHVARRRRDAP